MHTRFIEAKNFPTTCRSREWPQRNSASVNRFRISRESQADAEIDAEANSGDEIFARNFADFFGDG